MHLSVCISFLGFIHNLNSAFELERSQLGHLLVTTHMLFSWFLGVMTNVQQVLDDVIALANYFHFSGFSSFNFQVFLIWNAFKLDLDAPVWT